MYACERCSLILLTDGGHSSSGQYYLGVRTTLELESLLEGRPDITACLRCRKLVTKGSRCANSACDAALHWHCIAPLFAAAGNGGKVCPQCARAWADEEHGDGEEEDHDQVVAAPARRGKGKKRASMGRMDATNMDMDE